MMRKKLNLSPLDRQGSFPFYTIAPVAGTILCNMLTYYGSRLITRGLPHWDLTLPLDRWIPFVPSAVSIYVLAFLSWVVGIWVIARESPAVCYEVLAGEQIAKLLCLACFLLLPTTMERPEVTGSGFFPCLTRLIYRLDSPDNLLPSIHCLENWICFRGAFRCSSMLSPHWSLFPECDGRPQSGWAGLPASLAPRGCRFQCSTCNGCGTCSP